MGRMADKGKADRPSNTGTHVGETRPREGGHTIQQRETRRETMRDKGKHVEAREDKRSQSQCGEAMGDELGDKRSGMWTHHPTLAHMWVDNRGHWETMGVTGTVGRQRRTRGDKTALRRQTHHPTQAHICRETMGRQDLRRRTHLPTQAHTCHNGRQWETRGDKTSGRRTHHPTPRWTPKKALKTPNSTLFGEKERVKMCQENGRPGWCRHDYPHKSPREPNYPTCSKQL